MLLKIAPLPMGGLGFSASAARSSVSGSAPGTGGSKASWGGVKGLQPGSGGATGSGLMLPPGSSQFGSYPMAGRCGFAIKVADFGLSVKMENSHISGLRQGTPFYAAPVRCAALGGWGTWGLAAPRAGDWGLGRAALGSGAGVNSVGAWVVGGKGYTSSFLT